MNLYEQYSNRPVLELQTYLREISKNRREIPMINPDGVFGPKTEEAVRAFQRLNGLPDTGIVDINTWNLIVSEYDKINEESKLPLKIAPFPSSKYTVSLGSTGDIVYIIQIILNTLGKRFTNNDAVDLTGKYDQKTSNVVKEIQKKTLLPATGEVDKNTWNKLSDLYNEYRPRY